LVDDVDIGLISFDNNGKIEIYNRAAVRYIKVQQPRQISSIEIKNDEMYKIINTIKPGHEILHKITIENLLQSVLIKATEFKFDNNVIKLVSFQDITNELDKSNYFSYHGDFRVL
jgi:sensor histidine kinase regulating citrate/malate metabolism